MIVTRLGKVPLRGNAQPRAKGLEQNRHQVRKQDDAEKRITETRSARQIGRPISRVHVADGNEITRAGKGEKLAPKARARRDENRAVRFRQARRHSLKSPTVSGGNFLVHKLES